MSEKYDLKSKRGYFGIGIYQPKFASNVGVLWRSAYNWDASFIFTIGARCNVGQRTDVIKAHRHIPMLEYDNFEDFIIPKGCSLISVEIDGKARELKDFKHPERAIYMLGAEDSGVSRQILDKSNYIVQIPSKYCLNVSIVGSIVLYDRIAKNGKV